MCYVFVGLVGCIYICETCKQFHGIFSCGNWNNLHFCAHTIYMEKILLDTIIVVVVQTLEGAKNHNIHSIQICWILDCSPNFSCYPKYIYIYTFIVELIWIETKCENIVEWYEWDTNNTSLLCHNFHNLRWKYPKIF